MELMFCTYWTTFLKIIELLGQKDEKVHHIESVTPKWKGKASFRERVTS